jgi:hypothetical protein
MRKKRMIVIVVIVALAVGLVIAIPMLVQPAPGLTYGNFSRVEIGMNRERVEGFLGKPDSNHEHFEGILQLVTGPNRSLWQSESGDFATIIYDENDYVIAMWWNGQMDDRTAMEKLRDRLPLIARRPPSFLFEVK